jgi:hypothetical protein
MICCDYLGGASCRSCRAAAYASALILREDHKTALAEMVEATANVPSRGVANLYLGNFLVYCRALHLRIWEVSDSGIRYHAIRGAFEQIVIQSY